MNLPGGSEVSLAFLIVWSAKTTILLAFTWVTARAARHRSSAFRHLVWAAGILGSLTLPLLSLVLPVWHSAALGNAAGLLGPAHPVAADGGSSTLPAMIVDAGAATPLLGKFANVALLAWTAGFLFFAIRLVAGLACLAWKSVLARPLFEDSWMRTALELSRVFKIARPVRLRLCDDSGAMPLTWGFLRPLVILPSAAADWQEDRRRIVLSHEFAHIARNDWFLQVCAELARAVYWFHPLVWVAAERLRQESELACDDAVLNSGIQPSEYANQLLDLARSLQHSGRAWSSALAIARRSNLERRFASMLNPSVYRRGLSLKSRWLTALSAFCLLLPLAVLRLPAQNVSGKFSGTIRDVSGASVPNATIIMTNRKANIDVEMTTSDAAGNFVFKALPAGEYDLKVLKRGFEEYQAPQVVLEPGREASRNVTLQVAAVMDEVDVVAEGTAKPLPSSGTSGKPARLRVGGDVEAAKRLNLVTPAYPQAAKAAGIQGTVILHAIIGMDGTPLSLRVMNSEIDPELTRSAVEAVSKWRYRPTFLNGEPIEVDTTIMVNFTLLS
jgi:TonB family protein